MFDDPNIQGGGNPPPNLPVGEPEDMFAAVQPDDAPEPSETVLEQSGAEPLPPAAPSALESGVLKPKVRPEEPMRPVSPRPPEPPALQESVPPRVAMPPSEFMQPITYPTKSPRLSRYLLLFLLVLFGAGIFGGGGWFLYNRFLRGGSGVAPEQAPPPPGGEAEEPLSPPAPAEDDPVPVDNNEDNVLFGEPIDPDGDGLDSLREMDIGTDPNQWDTDADGLGDQEEITVWKTDPLNADTDADTYPDGEEVENGYNPAGPGRIFEPPRPATSTP